MKYFYPVNAWLPRNATVVNLKAFEALDKATQEVILKAASTAESRGWAMSEQKDKEYMQELAAKGMKIAPVPQAVNRDLRGVGETMTAEWLKTAGADGKQIIDAFQKH